MPLQSSVLFCPLKVQKEVKQYPVVGDAILFRPVQVKWRGCSLRSQWEIAYATEHFQQRPSCPHASSLFHGLAFLPFTPALSLSADVICSAYVVKILRIVPTLLHSPSPSLLRTGP